MAVLGCESQAGWTTGDSGKFGGRSRSNKSVERKRGKNEQSYARVVRVQDSNSKLVGLKKSTWTRI